MSRESSATRGQSLLSDEPRSGGPRTISDAQVEEVVVRTVAGAAAWNQRAATGSFSRLDLTGSNQVTVVVGGRQSVVVHADGNLIGRVTTRVVAEPWSSGQPAASPQGTR